MPPAEPTIRPATAADHEAVWRIFHTVVATGDTYPHDPGTSREEALAYWFQPAAHTFVAEVAEKDRRIVGAYLLKPNQIGLGAHVANAAFIVDPHTRGLGIGRRLGEHCLAEAGRRGFLAMQFNFVISTNTPSVRLWQQLGFAIVGTLPKAFRHAKLGLVDAFVMFRSLEH